jgi:hypothetical protein
VVEVPSSGEGAGVAFFTTGSTGGLDLSLLGGGGPADLYAQFGLLDPAPAFGVAFSNALHLPLLP